jgi:hypothetical protein
MRSCIVRAALLLVAALLVPACSTQKRKNPPVITFTSPSGGATNVAPAPVIYIRYDKDLDPATIPGSFILADTVGVINCSVTYYPALLEVRMIPNSSLVPDRDHQVTILAGIKSTDGAQVSANLFFQFHTKNTTDVTRPGSPTNLAVDVPSTTQSSVTLTWTNSTDDVGVDHYDVFMALSPGLEDYTSRLITGATPQPITGLAAGTTYYFVVRAVDAAGNTDTNTTEVVATTLP